MRDSYEIFFSEGHLSKQQFFDFGLRETIFAPLHKATEAWEDLKLRIKSDSKVFIRGYGKDGNGTHLFQSFYANVLGNHNVSRDSTNNSEPTRLIRDLTNYSKTKNAKYKPIRNYQISHVFGRTKNVYAFTAPWNIAYIPKMLDPFTGHEAKGEMVDEYKTLFQQECYGRFSALVDDFNDIVTDPSLKSRIEDYLDLVSTDATSDPKEAEKLRKSLVEEFSPIVTK